MSPDESSDCTGNDLMKFLNRSIVFNVPPSSNETTDISTVRKLYTNLW